MKESHGEGAATHTGPESCRVTRKGSAEVLAGERAGQVLSRERSQTPGRRRCYLKRKAHIRSTDNARCDGALRGRRPCARMEAPCAGTGRSQVCPEQQWRWDVSGSLRTQADDERTWEVGQTRSTWEVPEQCRATGGGGDGRQGYGQREPQPAKRGPDTEPDSGAPCAGAGTPSSEER